jgi:hypothetical protein
MLVLLVSVVAFVLTLVAVRIDYLRWKKKQEEIIRGYQRIVEAMWRSTQTSGKVDWKREGF